MAEPDVISVANVNKTYGGTLKAVDNLEFVVHSAECCSFLGPNGAGKTTMMKMLYAKAMPDKRPPCRIEVFGFDPRHQELEIKSLSGVAPQDDDLDEELSVIQNLRIFSRLYGMTRRYSEERIAYLLDFMELSQKKAAKIRELSGGMRRRLIIARALINDPRLLILDEPTTGLDPQVRQLIWDKLRGLKREGVTILLTTHYMEEAYQLADRVIIMDHGKKVLEGNPRSLLETHIEPHVLEVLNKDAARAAEPIGDGTIRREEAAERILFYAHEDTVLRRVAAVLPRGEYYLRHSNLEDLFIKATGRNLNAGQ